MVMDPAEYQRVLEENERMRNAGALLEQQLAVAESDNLKLSTELQAASSSKAAPTAVQLPRASQAIAPSAHVKGPSLTSFTGSMGFEVDHWLRSVRKQFNFFGSLCSPTIRSASPMLPSIWRELRSIGGSRRIKCRA